MATLATIADVLDSVETDLSDRTLQRLIDSAEEDVREYLTSTQRSCLPIIVWTGRYTPALGVPDGSLTLASPILGYPIVRFEGTVVESGAAVPYAADTVALDQDGGTDTLMPVTADGMDVPDGAFVVTIDSTGLILTVDTTLTTAAVTVNRVLGLQTAIPPSKIITAVLDLVKVAVIYRGITTEEVGQYEVTQADYHSERGKILRRLIYASDASLAA